jgi:hypothetical protein
VYRSPLISKVFRLNQPFQLVDLGIIRNKFGHMARVVEAQTAWMEALVYQLDHMSLVTVPLFRVFLQKRSI